MSEFTVVASTLFEFIGVYMLILALPGANCLVVAQACFGYSRRVALAAMFGIGVGAALLAATAVAGAAALAADPRAAIGGQVLAAAMVSAIGLKAARRACMPPLALPGRPRPGAVSHFVLGLVTAVTNPVTTAFFVSATLRYEPGTLPIMGSLLVASVFGVATVWFGSIAIAFSSDRVRGFHRQVQRRVDFLIGAVLAAIGLAAGLRLVM